MNPPLHESDAEALRTSLESLFLDVVDLPPAEQREFIRVHCEHDPESAAALEGLLAGERKTRNLAYWNTGELRFGPYRVTGRIGDGGMGEVYRAVRDDSEYQKDVAVKLIRRGMTSDLIVARFRNERQILANLDHPNIARLIDGGTDDQGSPYLVMEYVEGETLADYLKHRKPDLRARLSLFRQICTAVHYAHQRMVIHRDLKPRNILVTADGQPKLLDFGIAKLLEAGGESETPTVQVAQMLTPAYASPEQVRGEQVTTASDVYSLGVILYEMLTGGSPYRPAGTSPAILIREVCEQEPARPSLVGPRELKGDLDNIVLMALRKDPSRRYASVDRFSADVERYLNGFPVEARGDSIAYVTGKFVRRNLAWVIAASLVMVMAIASVVIVVRSAAVARQQRAKAEGRFNDVRELAHSFIFDVDTALDGIPAALPVRVLINQKAEAYLDRLSADAPSDLALRRELATSYNQLARVQGVPGHGNLGNMDAARVSLNKAVTLLTGSLAIDPKSYLDHGLLIAVYNSLGQLEWSTGDPASALAAHEKALKETDTLLAHIPHPPTRLLSAAGSAYFFVALDKGANFSNLGDPVSTFPLLDRSLELFRSIDDVKEPISEPYLSEYRNLANVERVYAGLLYQLDRPEEGEAHYRRAMDLLHSPRVDLRENNNRSVLLATETWHAYWLTTQPDLPEALPLSKSALHLAEELVREDPKYRLGLLYRHHAEFVFGRAEVLSGEVEDGFHHIDHALQAEEEILAADPSFAYASGFLTTHSVMAGSTALGVDRVAEAKRYFVRAVEIANAQSAAHPSDAQAIFNLSQAEFGLAEADPDHAAQHRVSAHEAARKILLIHPDNPWAQRLTKR